MFAESLQNFSCQTSQKLHPHLKEGKKIKDNQPFDVRKMLQDMFIIVVLETSTVICNLHQLLQ